MHLTHLSLSNFRSFARLDIQIPGGPVLLVGGNAQGKTTILEAIFYLATFTSFQADHDRQLISFILEKEPLAVARIVAEFRHAPDLSTTNQTIRSSHRFEIRLIREPNGFEGVSRFRKEILLDGVNRKNSEAIGVFNAVLFQPQMLRVVEGSPDDRRRFLNLAISQVEPHYSGFLIDYQRTLIQRNALLKTLAERGGDAEQLSYWDEQISRLGAEIICARIHAIKELECIGTKTHRDLTRGHEVLRLEYQPSFDPLENQSIPSQQYTLPIRTVVDRTRLTAGEIRQLFLDKLQRIRTSEIARGVTTIGPHRDDLRFLSNGIDLGVYGSRGQARTAILSLKLAELSWMKSKTGQWPVILLDEVLAELDPERRTDLLERLQDCEQALLTTTDLHQFPTQYVNSATLWQIQFGQVILSQ